MTRHFHAEADRAMSAGAIDQALRWLEQAVAQDPADFDGWMKLAALRRAARQPEAALDAVNAALGAQPNAVLALLLKGSLHEQLGDNGRAAEAYRAVLFHTQDEEGLPPQLVTQLQRARQFLDQYRSGIEAAMPILDALDDPHQAKAARFLDNVLDRRAIFHSAPTHYHYPGLSDVEFFDTAYLELKQRLRDASGAIRTEFEALLAAYPERQRPYVDFAPGQPMAQFEPLNRNPDWNAFHLIRYGEVDPVLAAACPRTIAAFSGGEQPDIAGLTPNLMFSLLAPHTRIPAHVGVANFRVLVHLPLIVPGQCFFRVGADTREWVEGEPWVFDDSMEHEAWNDSDQLRVILIGDLWRPELSESDRRIVRELCDAQSYDGQLGAL